MFLKILPLALLVLKMEILFTFSWLPKPSCRFPWPVGFVFPSLFLAFIHYPFLLWVPLCNGNYTCSRNSGTLLSLLPFFFSKIKCRIDCSIKDILAAEGEKYFSGSGPIRKVNSVSKTGFLKPGFQWTFLVWPKS